MVEDAQIKNKYPELLAVSRQTARPCQGAPEGAIQKQTISLSIRGDNYRFLLRNQRHER